MDKSVQFLQYRNEYKVFYYNSFSLTEDKEAVYLEYNFEIPGLSEFSPTLKILKKNMKFKSIESVQARNMAFNIGMIELISYWKCVCPPKILVKCGALSETQIKFWKKIYFYGLGELFYTNNIHTTIDEFVNIESTSSKDYRYEQIVEECDGYIVPIGGGKDSVVTLETLKINHSSDYALIINPKPVTLKCAELAGLDSNNIIEIYRSIDKRLIELNERGFINGHTPFSAMLAFVSYFTAYLLSKKYVALSNESSANEANVAGEKINHQYSKSFEFECDFEAYSSKFLKAPVKYFSFLRPLNELQIAKIFSKHEKYHHVFKSCNVGSKGSEWKWCCNCAKCLFAYIILSPFLYREKLVSIFGEDLYDKESLLQTFIELTGNGDVKPFDCVGTFEEVKYAISKTIRNQEQKNKALPMLLKYYKDNYKLDDSSDDIIRRYNNENNLTIEQSDMLRKEVF